MALRIYVTKDSISSIVIVDPQRDAFGRYKTKEFLNTTQGKIARKYITKIENLDEPWLNDEEAT